MARVGTVLVLVVLAAAATIPAVVAAHASEGAVKTVARQTETISQQSGDVNSNDVPRYLQTIMNAYAAATTDSEREEALALREHVRVAEEAVGLVAGGDGREWEQGFMNSQQRLEPEAEAVQTHGRRLGELPCFDSCLDILFLKGRMDFCYMVDYPTCPVGTSIEDAQTSAKSFYDTRIALPDHNGVSDCTNALQHFACYTYFPKCEWTAISYTTCHSTCDNYQISCELDEGSLCDGYEGVGPSDTCTGAASGHGPQVVLVFLATAVAVVAASMLL